MFHNGSLVVGDLAAAAAVRVRIQSLWWQRTIFPCPQIFKNYFFTFSWNFNIFVNNILLMYSKEQFYFKCRTFFFVIWVSQQTISIPNNILLVSLNKVFMCSGWELLSILPSISAYTSLCFLLPSNRQYTSIL